MVDHSEVGFWFYTRVDYFGVCHPVVALLSYFGVGHTEVVLLFYTGVDYFGVCHTVVALFSYSGVGHTEVGPLGLDGFLTSFAFLLWYPFLILLIAVFLMSRGLL